MTEKQCAGSIPTEGCSRLVEHEGTRMLDRKWFCDAAVEEIVRASIMKSGQSRKMVLVALGLVGKKGRGTESKAYGVLAKAAGQKGMSRQDIDQLTRQAMDRD